TRRASDLLLDALERDSRADAAIDALTGAVRALPLGRARDALHGLWLGHPLHPLMVQVPVGSWMSAAVLDLWPGRSREAGVLVGVGLAAAGPAALAGAVDWAELRRQQTRVGLVHAVAERCSHQAGPRSEGTVADGCVRCPWHGSVFRLSDGWNVRGPATAPQPAFDTRVLDGHVEIRLRVDGTDEGDEDEDEDQG